MSVEKDQEDQGGGEKKRLTFIIVVWVCGKRQDYGPEYAFSELDGTILLGRTATVLVAVLYNKDE